MRELQPGDRVRVTYEAQYQKQVGDGEHLVGAPTPDGILFMRLVPAGAVELIRPAEPTVRGTVVRAGHFTFERHGGTYTGIKAWRKPGSSEFYTWQDVCWYGEPRTLYAPDEVT